MKLRTGHEKLSYYTFHSGQCSQASCQCDWTPPPIPPQDLQPKTAVSIVKPAANVTEHHHLLALKICSQRQRSAWSSQLPIWLNATKPKTACHNLLTLKICSQRQRSEQSSQQPLGSWSEYHQGECTHPQDLWSRAGGGAVQPAACWTVFLQGAAVTAPATLVLSIHAETFATVGHQQGALVDTHWWTWEWMSLMFKFKLIIKIWNRMTCIFQALNKLQQINQKKDKFLSHFSSFLTI